MPKLDLPLAVLLTLIGIVIALIGVIFVLLAEFQTGLVLLALGLLGSGASYASLDED